MYRRKITIPQAGYQSTSTNRAVARYAKQIDEKIPEQVYDHFPMMRTLDNFDLGYCFRSSVLETLEPINSVTEGLYGWYFSLDTLPNVAALVAKFHFYRITAVEIGWFPQMNTCTSTGNITNYRQAIMITAVDTNNATPPSGLSTLREMETHKVRCALDHFREFIHPKWVDSSHASRDDWVSTTNTSEPWYGYKIAANANGSVGSTNVGVVMSITYYVECKEPK